MTEDESPVARQQDWARVKDVLNAAVEAPPDEREAVVARLTGDDAHLRATVLAYLRDYEVVGEGDLPSVVPPRLAVLVDRAHEGVSPGSPTRPGTSAAVPRTWGDYTLLEEIGRGGYGVVYRAWEHSLAREVALKLIDTTRHPGQSEQIRLEGQSLARVDHRNVVRIHAIQPVGDELAIVMEYLRGQTLAQMVAERGPLPARDACLIVAEICDALVAVHARGLVHRDIKASNVLRTDAGRVVLMDFGASRRMSSMADTRNVGTPEYMAPEVLHGEAATPASDVYSLGILLQFLVSGTHLGTDDIPLGQAPAMSAAVSALIARMTDGAPGRRPAMDVRLRRALEEAAGAQTHDAGTPATQPVAAGSREGSTTVPFPPAAEPGLLAWSNLLKYAAGGVALCFGIGLVSTAEYNLVLGREAAFASESPLLYLRVGQQALVLPAVLTVGLAIVWAIGGFAWRLLSMALPTPTSRMRLAVHDWRTALVDRGWLTRSLVLQAVCLLTVGALLAIVVRYRVLFSALASSLIDGPREVFGTLHSRLETPGDVLSLLYLTALVTIVGIHLARYLPPDEATSVSQWAVIGVGVLAALLFAVSYRTLHTPAMRMVRYETAACYVLGQHMQEIQIHCPSHTAPRNHVVGRDDRRLAPLSTTGVPFDAYPAVPGYDVPDTQ